MKRLLLASVFALAVGPAFATITLNATCDGVACGSATDNGATLTVTDQTFGLFNLNSLSINSQAALAAPVLLSANTLDVDQNVGGVHSLVLDITATGITGTAGLQDFLSSFSVSGQSAGWSVIERTTINGNLLATTPVFSGVSDSASSIDAATVGSTFTVDEHFLISSNGTGSFNGGIDVSSAVPEPATWAMMLLGFVGLAAAFRNRRRVTAALA